MEPGSQPAAERTTSLPVMQLTDVSRPARKERSSSTSFNGTITEFPELVQRRSSSHRPWRPVSPSSSDFGAPAAPSSPAPSSPSPRASRSVFVMESSRDTAGLDYVRGIEVLKIYEHNARKRSIPETMHFCCAFCRHWRVSSNFVKSKNGVFFCTRECEAERVHAKLDIGQGMEREDGTRKQAVKALLRFMCDTHNGKALCAAIRAAKPGRVESETPNRSHQGSLSTISTRCSVGDSWSSTLIAPPETTTIPQNSFNHSPEKDAKEVATSDTRMIVLSASERSVPLHQSDVANEHLLPAPVTIRHLSSSSTVDNPLDSNAGSWIPMTTRSMSMLEDQHGDGDRTLPSSLPCPSLLENVKPPGRSRTSRSQSDSKPEVQSSSGPFHTQGGRVSTFRVTKVPDQTVIPD